VDWASVGVRFALYLDVMLACGLAVFALIAPAGTARAMPLRPLLLAGGCFGLALSAGGLLIMTAAMAGTAVAQLDRETLTMVVAETSMGSAWIARMVALVLAIVFAASISRRTPTRPPIAASAGAFAFAVASLAWGGHGVMNEGALGQVHVVADIIHLLAAAVWIGSLAGLVLLVSDRRMASDVVHVELSWRALHGFSLAGTIVVGLIVVSGAVNAWLIVGPDGVATLFSTMYGQLLIAKIAAFTGMAVLASLNRFRLTPALRSAATSGDQRRQVGALRLSLTIETALAVLVLALVAWLGTLEPAPTLS
jgi:putative copper resistance protein D